MPFIPIPPLAPDIMAPALALICIAALCLLWVPKIASLFAGAGMILAISFMPGQGLWVLAGLMAIATLLIRPQAGDLAILICAGFGAVAVTVILASAALEAGWSLIAFCGAVLGSIAGLAIGFGHGGRNINAAAYCCAGVAAVGLNTPFLVFSAGASVGLALFAWFLFSGVQRKGLS